MIQSSSEQINDQNHDHDPITSKCKKNDQIEKLENNFISGKWRKME